MNNFNIRNMIFLFLITFSFFASLDILQLPFPLYIEGLGGSPKTIGLLMGLTGIVTVIIRPVMGAWSDVNGKKGILIISMGCWFLSPLFLLMGDSFLWITVIRIFQSIGMAGVVLSTQALMIEQVEQKDRGQAMALQGIGDASAIVLGPLIGFWLMESFGFNWVFIAAALAAALGFMLTFFVREEKSKHILPNKQEKTNTWKELVKDPLLLIPTMMGFGLAFSFGAVLVFMAVFANQLGIANIGYLFAFLGIFLILGRYAVGRVSDKIGREIVILPTIILTAAGMFIISFFSGGFYFYFACALIGLGFGGGHTGLLALVVDRCSSKNRGFVISFLGSSFDLGISIAGFTLGIIANYFSYSLAYFTGGAIVLIFGGVGWIYFNFINKLDNLRCK